MYGLSKRKLLIAEVEKIRMSYPCKQIGLIFKISLRIKKMICMKLIIKEIYVKLELTTKSYIQVLTHHWAQKGHTFRNFMCQLKLLKINKGMLERQLPGWLSSFNMYVCMWVCMYVCMHVYVYMYMCMFAYFNLSICHLSMHEILYLVKAILLTSCALKFNSLIKKWALIDMT